MAINWVFLIWLNTLISTVGIVWIAVNCSLRGK